MDLVCKYLRPRRELLNSPCRMARRGLNTCTGWRPTSNSPATRSKATAPRRPLSSTRFPGWPRRKHLFRRLPAFERSPAASALLERGLEVAGGLLRLAFGFLGHALGLLRLASDDLAGLFLNLAGGFLDRRSEERRVG